MDRKEETKSFKDKEDERFKEKIVYKIIPVPYYYPVPVDPDWYNKNYERQFRPNEFTSFPFVDTTVEHFVPPPPPGFPFPRFRHPHHHFIYEPSSKRVVSPPPQTTIHAHGVSPPKKHAENGRDEDIPLMVKHNQNNTTVENIVPVSTPVSEKNDIAEFDRDKETKKVGCDEIIIKTEIDDSETLIVNGAETPKVVPEENEIEAIRDRKRYLMTFPYDQKKKVKVNGHAEGFEVLKPTVCIKENESKDKPECTEKEPARSEPHETHFAAFPPNAGIRYPVPSSHQPVMPPAVPYVMVPVQSPAFLHPKIIHQPHFPTEHTRPRFDEPKTIIDSRDSKIDIDERSKEQQKAESPGEVKYHPNGRRARTVFTRQQLLTLNNVFEKHHFVSGERMSELSDQLGLDRKIVKIWFQNKRQYSRKKGSLLEREEDFYEYQDSFSSGTAPPTMTMVNHTRNMDDINYKLNDENVTYKINDEYMSEKSGDENSDFKVNEEKVSYEVNEPV